MSEEHKDGCCGPKASGCGCGCGGGGKKFVIGLLIGAFIFASGMWFAKSSCSGYKSADGGKMCPMGSKMGGSMVEAK